LVREARRKPRDLGGVEIVEESLAQRLGDDEIGLGVEVGEDVAPLRYRPVIDVTPRFYDAQDAVELAGAALGPAPHAALEPCHLAFEALGRSGRAHPRLAVAIARDGVPGELRFEVRRPVRRAPPLSVIGPVRPHTAK